MLCYTQGPNWPRVVSRYSLVESFYHRPGTIWTRNLYGYRMGRWYSTESTRTDALYPFRRSHGPLKPPDAAFSIILPFSQRYIGPLPTLY
jgi:hypothetical protein